jgi:signal transduction histidine kinase
MIELMQDAVSMVSDGLRKRAISLEKRFQRPSPPVSGDRTRLIRVLINLLKNAGEAFDADARTSGRKLVIEICGTGDGRVRLSIRDNAVGFDAETAKRLFDRGFSTKNRSSGMGLDQCRDIIVSHGGALRVESAGKGQGATAVIELPVAKETTE